MVVICPAAPAQTESSARALRCERARRGATRMRESSAEAVREVGGGARVGHGTRLLVLRGSRRPAQTWSVMLGLGGYAQA